MIKPVTFQGASNFKANLYALDVKSRFKNLHADGYYKDYGDEISATVISNTGIQINSGALLVQGRMIEIVSSETVAVTFENGKVGYLVMRIETHPSNAANMATLVTYTADSLSGIVLTQEDVYSPDAESTNKVYELPIYSFAMQGNSITNVVKIINSVDDAGRYLHRVFLYANDTISNLVAEIDVDLITTSPRPISDYASFYAALSENGVQPNSGHISCVGTLLPYGGEYEIIFAITVNVYTDILATNTEGTTNIINHTANMTIVDNVIEL